MDPEPLRNSTRLRRTVAGAVAVIAVGAVGIVWLVVGDEPEPTTAVAPAAAPVIEEPRLALAPVPAASAVAEIRVELSGEVQMCGGTWVRLKDDGDVDWDSVNAASKAGTEALATSVIAAMASSADEQARAAALAIAMPPVWQARVKPSACEGDVACQSELTTAVKEWAERRDTLARLAQDSSDATVYGWAVQACRVAIKDGPGHCQVISAAQWARRLDPGNAAPWIAVAARARDEKDAAGLDDALFRIATAERYDPGEYKLGSILLDHVPDSETSLFGALSLVAQSQVSNASSALGDVQTLVSLCSVEDLAQDDARRDACERGAEMLVKGSTTLNGLMVGRVIGKRVDWSQERIDQLEKESRALESAWTRENPKGAESLGCKALQAQLDSIREYAAEGQVAALRRRVIEEAARTVAGTSVRSFAVGSMPPR